jgi:hypothetical protein
VKPFASQRSIESNGRAFGFGRTVSDLKHTLREQNLEGSYEVSERLENELARALHSLDTLRTQGPVLGSWTYGPLPTDYEGWSLPASTDLFDRSLQPIADDLAALVQHCRELQLALCAAWHAFEREGLPEAHFDSLVDATRQWYAMSARLAEAEVRFVETVTRKGFRGYHSVDR